MKKVTTEAWVVECCGLAVGYHARPRGTDDIDIIINNEDDLEKIVSITSSLFKRTIKYFMQFVLPKILILY